jgi:D-alanyl-D-alanine carboxypeptidase/D-alanyl-D-alanine-endopeptidase (penicillin-binding protein 4)
MIRCLVTALACGLALAAAPATAARRAPPSSALPPAVLQGLAVGQVPAEAMSAWVAEVGEDGPRLSWQARRPVNPASLAKLVTTYAALDLLGPAYVWRTPVWLTGPVRDGVLEGSLVLRGSGDPKLLHERVWLMLRQVRQMGVLSIGGDIVLDRSAFAPAARAPGDFDGLPLRAYNVQPDALLLSHRALLVTIRPDPARGVARLRAEPALDGPQAESTLPLDDGACDDWRAGLTADVDAAGRLAFGGRYAAACGERTWVLADPQPATYDARLLRALWAELGGTLAGQVRDGAAPAGRAPAFELTSPALAELVRDINKFSNNVMAEQLFLTLAAQQRPGAPASADAAREVVMAWLHARVGPLADGMHLANGSGLARETRLSAELLGRLLLQAWASPVMPEMVASLPLVGQDGTATRLRVTPGRAHLKTGTLRDVTGLAGYVLAEGGRRFVVVALIHHPQAPAARPALEALVQWVQDGMPPSRTAPP